MNLRWLLDILILFSLQLKIVKMKYMSGAISKLSGHFLFLASVCRGGHTVFTDLVQREN